MSEGNDDAVHLLRIATERKRQRLLHPRTLPFGPDQASLLAQMLPALLADARARQANGHGTMADVLIEEVCEMFEETPGTDRYEREADQVGAVAVRISSASRALRMAGR